MIIRFNQTLNTNGIAKEFINNTILDMYIEPANFRHLDEDQFDMSKLNFTWNTTEFKDTDLIVQLYFNEPH